MPKSEAESFGIKRNPTVMVNHGGTILTRKEFITEKDGYVQIDEYGFEASMTLEEWLEENN